MVVARLKYELNVVAFDEDEDALVIDRGRLRPGATFQGSSRCSNARHRWECCRAEAGPPVFRVHDGPLRSSPVVGFIIDADGMGEALLRIEGDDGPAVVRDDYPGVTLLEIHAPSAPTVGRLVTAPANGVLRPGSSARDPGATLSPSWQRGPGFRSGWRERVCDGGQLLIEASHQFPRVGQQAPIPRVVLGPCTDVVQDSAKLPSQIVDFSGLFVTEHFPHASAWRQIS